MTFVHSPPSARADSLISSKSLNSLPAASSVRDVRIDFFRGLALLVMVLDHNEEILSRPILSRLTYAPIGITTAAAVFFGLSGLTVGYAILPIYQRCGFWITQLRCVVRSWQLYVMHLVGLVMCTVVGQLVAQIVGGRGASEPLLRFDHSFILSYATPQIGVRYLDILPLYILMLLAAPMFLAVAARWPLAAWSGSFALYAWVQYTAFTGAAVSLPFANSYFYQPLAWQFLFATGIVLGVGWRLGWLRLKLARWQLGAMLVTLTMLCAWYKGARLLAILGWFPQAWRHGDAVPYDVPWIDKSTLGPLRVIHFLLACIVIAHLVPASSAWLKSRWARLVTQCGQQSLELYVFGVVLNYACAALATRAVISAPMVLALDIAVVGLSILFARFVSMAKRKPWKTSGIVRTAYDPQSGPATVPHRYSGVEERTTAAEFAPQVAPSASF